MRLPKFPMTTAPYALLVALTCAGLSISPWFRGGTELSPEGLRPIDPSAADSPEAVAWIEERLASLSLEERAGQLFVARVHSDTSQGSLAEAERLVRERHVGGVCFFSGTPVAQAAWTNHLQASAKTPLLVAMDAEWGAAMRLGGGLARFPYAMTMGAADDPGLTRAIGRATGQQLRRLGVHLSFAPVADLNSNPANPVIGRRSFGEDPQRVGRLATAYARGLGDAGVLAVAKHYPGHGDTELDSHHALPVVRKTLAQLDTVELVPFRMLAQDGVAGIMTAHLAMAAIDTRPNRPASLSATVTHDILRHRWQYAGLIVTDGLDMAGVTKHFSPADAAVEALLAGNDLLLVPGDIPAGIEAIVRAVRAGAIPAKRLDASVRRILRAKYLAGLAEYAPVDTAGVVEAIDRPEVVDLSERLYRAAATIVRRGDVELPLVDLRVGRAAVVSLGQGGPTEFQRAVGRYLPVAAPSVPLGLDPAAVAQWREELAKYDLVFVGLHGLGHDPKTGFGVKPEHLRLLRGLAAETKVVVSVFGSPYVLSRLRGLANVVVAYEDLPLAQKAAAEVIFGATAPRGTLPVTVGPGLARGTGVQTGALARLLYSTPGNAGFRESGLREVDRIAQQAIEHRATPGGIVLAARGGQVGYVRAYGRLTYDTAAAPVDASTVYDLASITKVAASTIAVMRLHEQGLISVYDEIGTHLPLLANTDKAGLRIHDILAHQARLQAWIPFFEQTVTDAGGVKRHLPGIYVSQRATGYSVPVTERLFIADAWRDTIWGQIARSPLLGGRGYKYSDLGFYLMAELVRAKTGVPLDEYVTREFYEPLGLATLGYRPLDRMDAQRVAPTEDDTYWRFGRVQGYVHDMGAAMLGGVSGHAGLFSDVGDLAVIGQLLLNDGLYGGRRYFKPETVRLFTSRHSRSTRRGLGWDMPELSSRGSRNVSEMASAETFGHLGFTGTCMWADPETGVLFVWLTNRTYPRMSHNAFNRDRYRPRMQSAVYESIE